MRKFSNTKWAIPAFLVQVWLFTHPPPPQTLTRKCSKIFLWIYPFHEISCILVQVWFFTHPHPPHHHLKLWWENFLSPNGPNSEKKFLWIYPFHEISYIFGSGVIFHTHPPPPPPPQTLTRKCSKSKWAKQWKIFFSGFIHFMKFPTFLVQIKIK